MSAVMSCVRIIVVADDFCSSVSQNVAFFPLNWFARKFVLLSFARFCSMLFLSVFISALCFAAVLLLCSFRSVLLQQGFVFCLVDVEFCS